MSDHVLVPVDRSSHSEAAFEYALEKHQTAAITLLHVIQPVSSWAYGDDEYFDFEGYQRAEQHQRQQVEELLEAYGERARDRGLRVETLIKFGKPARRILEVAEQARIDHIVMGSRGRSGVGRVLLGSVAETVTRRSPVPVTIIR